MSTAEGVRNYLEGVEYPASPPDLIVAAQESEAPLSLELAPIGWQVFARGFSLRDQPASSLPFGTFATRLLAQPLRPSSLSVTNLFVAASVAYASRSGASIPRTWGPPNTLFVQVLPCLSKEIAPVEPSTVICRPVVIRSVASGTPTMAGMPYSR